MFFKRIAPDPELEDFIECFWIIENKDPAPMRQKIIPDGFTEIIFHFKDPYRIKLGKQWQLQSKNLLAGQISKYFLLKKPVYLVYSVLNLNQLPLPIFTSLT